LIEFDFDISKTASYTVVLYDYAGKEVMTQSGDCGDRVALTGKTRSGVKIARGVYFARVIITDGRMSIEEIVKIAVK